MSQGCGCSGGVAPIVVQCCGSGEPAAPVKPEKPEPGDGNGGHKDPPPANPPCAVATVQFQSVRVVNSAGVGLFGVELAEKWDLVMDVNGHSATEKFDASDGLNRPLSEDPISVDLPNTSSVISVHVSGIAEALVPLFNSALPAATQQFGSAANWGLGTTQQIHASDRSRDYIVTYSISCLKEASQSAFSRVQAVDLVRQQFATLGDRGKISDDLALTVFINRMNAKGYRLKEIQGDLMLWEGARQIHRAVARVFDAGRPRGEKKRAES